MSLCAAERDTETLHSMWHHCNALDMKAGPGRCRFLLGLMMGGVHVNLTHVLQPRAGTAA